MELKLTWGQIQGQVWCLNGWISVSIKQHFATWAPEGLELEIGSTMWYKYAQNEHWRMVFELNMCSRPTKNPQLHSRCNRGVVIPYPLIPANSCIYQILRGESGYRLVAVFHRRNLWSSLCRVPPFVDAFRHWARRIVVTRIGENKQISPAKIWDRVWRSFEIVFLQRCL